MNDLIETVQLDSGKSSYLIELLKHDKGFEYVKIEHVIQLLDKTERSSIKINSVALSDLIEVLINLDKKIKKQSIPETDRTYLIQNRYLKGISIKDQALQFNCNEKLIEIILRNRGIEIVSNEMPKNNVWRKYKRSR